MTSGTRQGTASVEDIGEFCRAVEAHLCRVNGGHLVRIVGPAFELVAGWARDGMPLRVVLHGVDRTVTRLTARGPRRRPVRIEFCDADVRDACDQWRRAVGVHAVSVPVAPDGAAGGSAVGPPAVRTRSLAKHLERVLVRLSSLSATQDLPPPLRDAVGAAIADVDACLDASRGARADARQVLAGRLESVERTMASTAIAALGAADRAGIDAQVASELSPYRGQMPPEALRDAEQTLRGDLARRHFGLPQVRVDG